MSFVNESLSSDSEGRIIADGGTRRLKDCARIVEEVSLLFAESIKRKRRAVRM